MCVLNYLGQVYEESLLIANLLSRPLLFLSFTRQREHKFSLKLLRTTP